MHRQAVNVETKMFLISFDQIPDGLGAINHYAGSHQGVYMPLLCFYLSRAHDILSRAYELICRALEILCRSNELLSLVHDIISQCMLFEIG